MTENEQRVYQMTLEELNKVKFMPETYVKTYKSRNGKYAITKVTTTYVTKLEEPREPNSDYNNNYNNDYNNRNYKKFNQIPNVEEEVEKFSAQRNQSVTNAFSEKPITNKNEVKLE